MPTPDDAAPPGSGTRASIPTERPLRPAEDQERHTALKDALSLLHLAPGAGPDEVLAAIEVFLEDARRKPRATQKRQALVAARWAGTLWGHQVVKTHGWEWIHLTAETTGKALAVASPERAWVVHPIRYVQDLLMTGRPSALRECFQRLRTGALPPSAPGLYLDLLPVPEDSPALSSRGVTGARASPAPRPHPEVTLRTRKPVDRLGPEDFAAFPVWRYALDEEGRNGQDETWVKPLRRRSSIELEDFLLLVAAEILLADGRKFPGYAQVFSGNSKDLEPSGLFLGGEHLGIPSGSAASREEFLRHFQASEAEVFPLRVRLALPFEGEGTPRVVVVP